ncbi:MAG: chromate transporter [Hyphomicrobiaceae bacterium]|nr:chromate transporter [Hyphomicrobiaceae bacterium]
MIPVLISLIAIFLELSLLAFGGGNTILPEMRRQVVDVHHWMTNQQFAALFALAQAAPGPNLMIVPLVGWRVAGLPGLLVSSLAMFGPSSVITCVVLHLWERFKAHRLRSIVQVGLVPVTAGLIAASAVVLTETLAHSWPLLTIAVASAALSLATRLHPIVLLAAGALVGLLGLGQS